MFRQLQEDILQRLLGDPQLADIDAIRHQAPVDPRGLGGLDGKTEDAIPNLDLAREQQGLKQALCLINWRGAHQQRAATTA